MREYIERTDELILAVNAGARVIENTKRYHGASYCVGVFSNEHREIPYLKAAKILRQFDEIPAADVVPVVHARRVNVRELAGGFAGDWGFDCSVCGATLPESLPLCKMNCCPNCGAKFAQEDDDNELC